MGFWLYMLVIVLLIPMIMIVTGLCFTKKPPKKINCVFGYRTSRSTRSPEAWEFANRYMGKLWYRVGMILLPVSLIPMLFVMGKSADAVGIMATVITVIQLIPVVGSIVPVERALKKKFGDK